MLYWLAAVPPGLWLRLEFLEDAREYPMEFVPGSFSVVPIPNVEIEVESETELGGERIPNYL